MKELIGKINSCETMPQLDALRTECVNTGKGNVEDFKSIQKAFVKKKNQLNRVPLFERNW